MQFLLIRTSLLLTKLPRTLKRIIVFGIDFLSCVFCIWLSIIVHSGDLQVFDSPSILAIAISLGLAWPIFYTQGLYDEIFRFQTQPAVSTIGRSILIHGIIFGFIMAGIEIENLPAVIAISNPLFLFTFVLASRIVARIILNLGIQGISSKGLPEKVNTLIYGAGHAGRQIAAGLRNEVALKIIGFIDDDSELWSRSIDRIEVFPPTTLAKLIKEQRVSRMILAIPSISRSRRADIFEQVSTFGIEISTLPSISALAGGKISIDDIKKIEINDILGREPIAPYPDLLSKKIKSKRVMVTGAGGSIGSVLCEQILRQKPIEIVLVENSEFALYSCLTNLEGLKGKYNEYADVELVPILCSVQDEHLLDHVFKVHAPETLYHVAAYKHVPLTQQNPLEALRNNSFGTLNVANMAEKYGVNDIILVSTDKAVRPTNIMGASKRIAELIFQSRNGRDLSGSTFSIVRFGNVLGSSGSVIPKFQTQIRSGGPVTITHPEATRFFMTIPEAAQLVIQAGGLATGGEVFVLKMGKPVKILDLARKLINLSGLTERVNGEPHGDIEIVTTGLRPGEKLHEEIFIGGEYHQTKHPMIVRANEVMITWDLLEPDLRQLKKHLDRNDSPRSFEVVGRLVEDFEKFGSTAEIIDEE